MSDVFAVNFQKLVLTLLFDHTKAKFVNSFTLGYGAVPDKGPRLTDEMDDAMMKKYGCTREQLAELQRAVNVLQGYDDSEEAKERWKQDFVETPLMSALLALMLARLPNLRKFALLDADDDCWKVFEYVTDAMSAASKHSNTGVTEPFRNLDKVIMGGASSCSTSIFYETDG